MLWGATALCFMEKQHYVIGSNSTMLLGVTALSYWE